MFDQVFWTDASQEEVFNQVCKPQVRTEAAGGILIKLPPPEPTLNFSFISREACPRHDGGQRSIE